MSYVAIWLQACLLWRCAYFQTLSWNDTIFVVDWDILYKLCGSANKCSKGFVFSGKIWWQFFSCNKACSKYHTRSTTTPKYTLTQRLVQLTPRTQMELTLHSVFPPSKENGYPVVTNKQKALNFIPVDLFNRFTVKSPKIRVMSPDILSHVARNK